MRQFKPKLETKMVQRKAHIVKKTDKALLLKLKSNGLTFFIPKSLCRQVNENKNSYTGFVTKTFEFPKWFLDEKIKENESS